MGGCSDHAHDGKAESGPTDTEPTAVVTEGKPTLEWIEERLRYVEVDTNPGVLHEDEPPPMVSRR